MRLRNTRAGLLDDWAKKVASGQQIPDPVISIQAKPEPMSTPPDTGRDVYHPPGRSFGCMPNAATLGGKHRRSG
ncbi:putative replication protein [Escherichia phage YDC107_2]|nr:putative replication protein [Escherichia phage YDC107_2]